MENNINVIKPLVGFGELKFGAEQSDVENYLGEPEEIEDLPGEADESDAEVWNYWKDGHTVFFEKDYDGKFTSFETDNNHSTLFGEKVFEMNEVQLTELMKNNGFKELDAEDEEWGERRISFSDAVMDFYFEEDTLISVSWGVMIDLDSEKAQWPE
ncbi:MAG: hypothetical protein EA361_04450 [Bacteroidetes bacterium]|nr:MAG: hypothetical protein EA361_04450 [Bacteroidota bacterium]